MFIESLEKKKYFFKKTTTPKKTYAQRMKSNHWVSFQTRTNMALEEMALKAYPRSLATVAVANKRKAKKRQRERAHSV